MVKKIVGGINCKIPPPPPKKDDYTFERYFGKINYENGHTSRGFNSKEYNLATVLTKSNVAGNMKDYIIEIDKANITENHKKALEEYENKKDEIDKKKILMIIHYAEIISGMFSKEIKLSGPLFYHGNTGVVIVSSDISNFNINADSICKLPVAIVTIPYSEDIKLHTVDNISYPERSTGDIKISENDQKNQVNSELAQMRATSPTMKERMALFQKGGKKTRKNKKPKKKTKRKVRRGKRTRRR